LPEVEPLPPVSHGRYAVPSVPRGDGLKPLPKVYGGRPIIGYWPIPAAVLLAALVAIAVIWAGGKLFGGDGPASVPTPDTSRPVLTTPTPVAAAGSPGVTPTRSASQPAQTPTGGGKFRIGDTAQVTGAAPDCLNVRVGPARSNDAIVCLKDGSEVTVTGGPEVNDGLRWWKVRTTLGEGWAAEDYLSKKP
jgi:hypothetical protein